VTLLDDEIGLVRRQVSVLLPCWLCGFGGTASVGGVVVSRFDDAAAMSEAIEQRRRNLGAAMAVCAAVALNEEFKILKADDRLMGCPRTRGALR